MTIYVTIYVTITTHFESFQYFNFETDFLKNADPFEKAGVSFFESQYIMKVL